MINKIKENKKLKAALFFGFYFFFFLFLFTYIGNNNVSSKDNTDKTIEEKEEIKEYSIKYLTDNNYIYHFIIDDDNKITEYNGTKENIDYTEFDNKYFLDIFNINQLIKKSKYINTTDSTMNYEISNDDISSLINNEKMEGISKINVHVTNGNLDKVILDLSSYMQKEKYLITLNYEVGEEDD